MTFLSKYRVGDVFVSDNAAYEIQKVIILLSHSSYRVLYYLDGLEYVTQEFLEQSSIATNRIAYNMQLHDFIRGKFLSLEFNTSDKIRYALDANNNYIVFLLHDVGVAVEYNSIEITE